MNRRIITLKGKSREEKVALAAEVKAEFERELPELARAREALVALGMMEPGFSAIRAIKTPRLDYDVRRDQPHHDEKLFSKPPVITKEIAHDIAQFQARKIREARAANAVPDRRGGRGRR